MVDFREPVKLNSNCFSKWEPVCAGVPQSAKLGPCLFLLMINDLSIPVGLIQGDMFKYADDTETSEYILDSACSSNMQCVTNSIINWSQQNKFELNPLKCKEIMINFNREQPDYPPILVNGTIIERVRKVEILGLVITDDLKWNEHVNKITIKAARRLYLLEQLKKSGLDINDLKSFYVASIKAFHYGLPSVSIMAFRNTFSMRLNAFKEEPLELSILIYLIKQPWINLRWLPCGREERNCVLNFLIQW